MKNAKEELDAGRHAFLANAGWDRATATPLAGDASTRRYERLSLDGRPAVLMIAPPGAEAPDCPRDADADQRRALGYNAMARLAGPNLNAFVAISEMLRSAGLSSPEIYAADPEAGYALIEDLGDDLFARVVGSVDEAGLYRGAIDALRLLHQSAVKAPDDDRYVMQHYDELALEAETALLLEWYWPLKKGDVAPSDLCEEYYSLWREAFSSLSAPHAPVLRDYHAENLLWLPNRNGVQRVGIIDFQDALFGHGAYDVVSLLEDARRDVGLTLADEMLRYYLRELPSDQAEAFERDYAILAAQRNAKILGIFARLAKRDGKPRYLDLLPRVEAHFRRDLARDGLAPIAAFLNHHFPEFA